MEVIVAAGVIERGGQILITQRKSNAHLGGLWEFPGGKKKSQETLPECLIRELKEELGVACEIGPELAVHSHVYPEKTVELHFFTCHIQRGEPQPLDCADLRWIRLEELDDYEFPDADSEFLKSLRTKGLDSAWFRGGT